MPGITRVHRAVLPALLSLGAAAGVASAQQVDFVRDVRPLLSDRCFPCHGPDEQTRKAGLRFDEPGSAHAPLRSGRIAVVPGDPDASVLWQRISSDDPGRLMPPSDSGHELDAAERLVLRSWIEQGGEFQQHWAYRPLERPVVPERAESGFVRGDVDRFVLAALEARGVAPSPRADPVTLIRRLALDLTGLPPEPEDVRDFNDDPSDARYAALVDRYLASDRHAERMAMWWLDLVRYADTCGIHGDQDVSVSPYRDWVVEQFRWNQPFDRFTTEQLAGDLLPDADRATRVASCYNRLNLMTAEGGAQAKEYLAKYAADRVRNASVVWLGATMGCCECHDHKYDPLSTREFYEFAAFFSDLEQQGVYGGANWNPKIEVPTREQERQIARREAEWEASKEALEQPSPEHHQAFLAWLGGEREKLVLEGSSWTGVEVVEAKAAHEVVLSVLEDGSVRASGANPEKSVYTLALRVPLRAPTALRIEALPDPAFPHQGPGRASNGNFVLTELVARVGDRAVAFSDASASIEQGASAGGHPNGRWAAVSAIDGDAHGPQWGWAVLPRVGQAGQAVFQFAAPLALAEGETLQLELHQNHGHHGLGRFRVTFSDRDPASLRPSTLDARQRELAVSAAGAEAAPPELRAHFAVTDESLAPLRAARDAAKGRLDAARKDVVTCQVSKSVAPRVTRVLPRGDWMNETGPVVNPGVPRAFGALEAPAESRLGRLDLAAWLFRPDHPATSRVLVNRLWALLFGKGLARKLDDFGGQGEPPTHPALLDHLAVSMVDSGWDVRALLRRVVLSSSYRMSSVVGEEQRRDDPENRWLARQGRWRLPAEMVRDQALWSSGLLVEKLGGVSARPYQPPGYYAQLNFPKREYQDSKDAQQWRRGLYSHWQRTFLHPMLQAFDAPTREECCVERGQSNTPLQALVLLNDPSFVEAARALAARTLTDGPISDGERIDWAHQRCTTRTPTEEVRAVLLELLERRRSEFADDPGAAASLVKTGLSPAAEGLEPIEYAAWTSVARALLNLHHSIARY